MYLKIIDNFFTENMYKEIAAITDRGILHITAVEYDREKRLILLPISRYRIAKKRKLLGTFTPYKLDKSNEIKSSIVIKNIIDCKIENNCRDFSVSEITMLFGLKIKGNEISICSAEETRGKTCYVMNLTISEIDIEIVDQVQATRPT